MASLNVRFATFGTPDKTRQKRTFLSLLDDPDK